MVPCSGGRNYALEVHRVHKPYDPTPYLAPESNNLILADDHICAILKNNLVVFEALQDN